MTGFTPELVERLVAELETVWLYGHRQGDDLWPALANKALEVAGAEIERWKGECRLLADTLERDQRVQASGIAELTEALRDYMFAEEIDDPAVRSAELSVCRQNARALLAKHSSASQQGHKP